MEDRGRAGGEEQSSPEEPHLVCQEDVLLHNAEASSDGQQLSLLLLLSGEIGEEDHLAVLEVVLPGVALHDSVFVCSLLSVGGAQIFLMVTQSRHSASANGPSLQTPQVLPQ